MFVTFDVEFDLGLGVLVCKFQGSSVSSFVDVIIFDMEVILEKGLIEEELQYLVEDVKKDFFYSFVLVLEVFFSLGLESNFQNIFFSNDNLLVINGSIELIFDEKNYYVLNSCVVEGDL